MHLKLCNVFYALCLMHCIICIVFFAFVYILCISFIYSMHLSSLRFLFYVVFVYIRNEFLFDDNFISCLNITSLFPVSYLFESVISNKLATIFLPSEGRDMAIHHLLLLLLQPSNGKRGFIDNTEVRLRQVVTVQLYS